jgi:hypothetical protein
MVDGVGVNLSSVVFPFGARHKLQTLMLVGRSLCKSRRCPVLPIADRFYQAHSAMLQSAITPVLQDSYLQLCKSATLLALMDLVLTLTLAPLSGICSSSPIVSVFYLVDW